MSGAQGWTLLGLVGVLLSVIGGLLVNQFHLLRGYLDARFDGLGGSIDARFDAVNTRLDALDRDVQGLVRDRFRRDD
ncbi:MAG: hypothetical protein QOJ60_201 [Actinomycetota bacterium]|jgi:Flp pilus assembly pilin Flp|nr:hypothetical protein [Actinomycetota bacterium]